MTIRTNLLHDFEPVPQKTPGPDWSERGEQLAHRAESAQSRTRRVRLQSLPSKHPNQRLDATIARAMTHRSDADAAAVLDNVRFLRSVERRARDFRKAAHTLPLAADASATSIPRVLIIARGYLHAAENCFVEADLCSFLDGYQKVAVLESKELSGMRAALENVLVDRLIAATDISDWPALITSLQRVGNTNWGDVFEAANYIDRVLASDPSGIYPRMDSESRGQYRKVIEDIACRSPHSEVEVAQTAVRLSRAGRGRRAHVGFYLADYGLARLEAAARFRPSLFTRFTRLVLRHPATIYLVSIELMTFFIVVGLLAGLSSLTPIFAGLILFLLPASQAAVDFVNNLITSLIPPRILPKLDFSGGIPEDCLTLVAVPALLLREEQIYDLVLDLEVRFLANRDRHLYFALLTDTADSDRYADPKDSLAELCAHLIQELNKRYGGEGRAPFFLLHRRRIYNENEGLWMGWERKRGKLLDLNRALRVSLDAFPVRVGDFSIFPKVRYVITLDSDTQLPRDSAARLVGTIAHPLNEAVVDPRTRIVVEGYGILQPRIAISIQSASRSRLAAFYSGQTGFDIYTRAVSDVYQDLFGEGSYVGKGIYDVDALRETLEHRFPENTLLSHDLIEGAYARAGLVSDIELIDDYPSHFSSYNRRKHRWVRGDWQVLRWLLPRVPDFSGRMIRNPISPLSQWKILDNLRRSLFEPSLLLLFVGSWLYLPQVPAYWTAAAVAVLFLPAYWRLLFACFHTPLDFRQWPPWTRNTATTFLRENAAAFFSLVFLLHQALVLIDAIARSLVRVFVTRRKLLEWETAAESEGPARGKATVDFYLEWTPAIALGIGVAVWAIRPAALPAAAPVLFLWLISREVSAWLNRLPLTASCRLTDKDTMWLRTVAVRVYRYFSDWSSPATAWLIPDSVHENGAADLRLSPTNLGLLFNARIAAVLLGLTTLAEFVFETRRTLESVISLPKYRGHLFNWYDIASLAPLDPKFVSTVDSGNLAASLWVLKQAAASFAAEPPAKRGLTPNLVEELKAIGEISEHLVREMDFQCLYNSGRRALSIGIDANTNRLAEACYDMLASEARLAVFVAIAKNDVPQEAWYSLARTHTSYRGEKVLVSWTGTMFEYLMPILWMRHYPGTLNEQSAHAAIAVQRSHAHRKGVPWGISESACLTTRRDPAKVEYGYGPFGISAIAMKRSPDKLVIAPYATFLALAVKARESIDNLQRMEALGWSGRYGFYEAVEYTQTGSEVIRFWMAHHQAMSMLAIVNLLFDFPIQHYFHAEPQVMATELLLHERAPVTLLTEPAGEQSELEPIPG
jgi:cyclic beta-1,2-glucan synthetase